MGSLEDARSGHVAPEVSSGLGRYRWPKWRSPANGVGNFDGNGKILCKCKGRRKRSGGVGAGLGEGFRACQSPGDLGLGDACQFPRKDLTCALRLLRAPEKGAVRRMRGRAATNDHGYPARVQVELLVLRTVLQDALSEVMEILPPLNLRVFVDDITALVKGRNKEVAEMAKKAMRNLMEDVEKKGLKLSATENGKEGKSKMIASCRFLENDLRQF